MRFLLISVYFIWISSLTGCGYQLEGTNPKLPAGAHSLAILPIQNRTFQTGLETRLMRNLRQLLRNNSSVNLSNVQNAELVLDIQLRALNTKQTSVSADGFTVELQLVLEGNVILQNKNQKKLLWREGALDAKGVLLYEKGEASTGLTGSTIGRGLDEVTSAFAKRVYERIFFRF
ncbi:MAG: hypothetical protein HQM14_03415 [SAR324 cluster bacterium]|nr:hypothetical protein [SAR324 cluster bacterium]